MCWNNLSFSETSGLFSCSMLQGNKPPQMVPTLDLKYWWLQGLAAWWKGPVSTTLTRDRWFQRFFSILTLLRNPPIWLVDTRKIHPQPIFFFQPQGIIVICSIRQVHLAMEMTPNFSVFTNPTHCQTQTSGETHQCSRTHVWEAQLSNEQNMNKGHLVVWGMYPSLKLT